MGANGILPKLKMLRLRQVLIMRQSLVNGVYIFHFVPGLGRPFVENLQTHMKFASSHAELARHDWADAWISQWDFILVSADNVLD
jgi:hypothetical protein